MSKIKKAGQAILGGAIILGYGGLVAVNIWNGNWAVACSMIVAAATFWN